MRLGSQGRYCGHGTDTWLEDAIDAAGYATVINCPIACDCDATQLGECDGLLTMVGGEIVVEGELGCARLDALCAHFLKAFGVW